LRLTIKGRYRKEGGNQFNEKVKLTERSLTQEGTTPTSIKRTARKMPPCGEKKKTFLKTRKAGRPGAKLHEMSEGTLGRRAWAYGGGFDHCAGYWKGTAKRRGTAKRSET